MRIIIICFCFQLLGSYSYSQGSNLAKLYSKYQLSEKMLNDWKADTNGCKKLREIYSNELEKNEALIGISKQLVLSLFGKPNYVSDQEIYTYAVGSTCDTKNKRIESDGYMDLLFFFKNGKLTSINHLIEEAK